MRGRKRGEVPARLVRLSERFASWRRARAHGERIPAHLWSAAKRLARVYGVSRTASVLKLDYYALKKRMDAGNDATESRATFVELPSAPMVAACECVIQWEDPSGASMRVHLKGGDLPDVLALGRTFWSGE